MTKIELLKLLKCEGFRADAYSLDGGVPEERYCLDYCHGIWSVYYSERGLQSGKREFSLESDACEFFLKLIKDDPTTVTGVKGEGV
ncbi:MAG: hypothetical protein ACRD22_05745 [Terriglobia bacterium]